MNYSLEYIDLILLAMIAGFIFLRLRGILGKRSGLEGETSSKFENIINNNIQVKKESIQKENFDKQEQQEFLKGAEIAYETIITDFGDSDNKLIASKPLLSKKIYDQFSQALKERSKRGHYAEITFIGVNSAKIKEHKKLDKILNVTVDFIAEVITCIKDKEQKVISGDSEKIKKIYDTWVFSRDTRSKNPNWQLVDTLSYLNSKISDKDKKDWEEFLLNKDKLPDKDFKLDNLKKTKILHIDLHGFTLENANKTIKKFIENGYENGVSKIIVVTGKGLHSTVEKDPYVSKDLSILKYSVPEFIHSNNELMSKIVEIQDASIEDGGSGAFYILLKKKL